MRNKRVVVAVIVTLFAASIGPGAIASAQEPLGLTGSAGVVVDVRQPDPELSEEMIEAIERDVGIPAGQVETRLANEAAASEMAEELDTEVGEPFAGAWFADGAAELTVAVTEQEAASEIDTAAVEVQVVDHSSNELEAMTTDLDESEAQAPAGVVGWYVDVATNKVALQVLEGSEAEASDFAASVLGDAVAADAVSVEATEAAPEPFYDVRGGDAYYTGQYRCSVGFSVVGGYTTAGHCGDVGATTQGYNRVEQGVFQGSQFPGADHAWVEVNQDWTPQPVVNNYGGGTVEVHGSEEAAVGATVCRSGSTTGWRCGTIQATNQTVRYAEGTVTGLTATSACAEGGDSGGSFISGNQAQGMTSGGSGNCTFGGTTFFQPLNPALQQYGLTLVTTG